MPLELFRVSNLRCLSHVEVRLDARLNYLFGANGAGKTSFLEGVYLLSRGRSFRTRQTRRIVQRGAEGLVVYGETRGASGGGHRLGVEVGTEGLRMRIDGRVAAGISELAEVLRVDVIDPSVHRLIEAGPTERRRFLDWGVFHVEHDFLPTWRRYRRALAQRNAALKSARGAQGPSRLWDEPLIEAATAVTDARHRHVERLRPVAAEVGLELLGRHLDVGYANGWREGEDFREALAASWRRDALAGATQVGPHRADLRVSLNEQAVAEEASRGQQKLAAAALVIAQVRSLSAATGTDGLLLVDDPAAELDAQALARLLGILEATPGQLVLTALSARQLEPRPGRPVFHVEQGKVQQCYNASV